MTVREYTERKNELIKKYTEMVLVPEDQIVDMELPEDKMLSMDNDGNACPYCLVFSDSDNGCPGCPMSEAGNCCSNNGSTYANILKYTEDVAIVNEGMPWYEELYSLVIQFNKENQ